MRYHSFLNCIILSMTTGNGLAFPTITKSVVKLPFPYVTRTKNPWRAGSPPKSFIFTDSAFYLYTPGSSREDDQDGSFVEKLEVKFDPYIVLIPVLFNVLAFSSFHTVEDSYERMYEMFARAMGVNFKFVDGGNIQAQMISPTLNGIVLPTASLLFSTMVSNTIGTLRGRIQDIKLCLTKEAADIFKLSTLIDMYPENGYFDEMTTENVTSLRKQCKRYLRLYTEQLIAESQDGYDHDSPDMTSQVQGQDLYRSIQYYEGYVKDKMCIPEHILTESLALIDRLDGNRMTRMTLLRKPYPMLHYLILGILATAIIFAFLMQTNQDILQFMNEVQLTLLWTMLVGALSLIGLVIYDLNGPFRGSYRVNNALRQLVSIRSKLKE